MESFKIALKQYEKDNGNITKKPLKRRKQVSEDIPAKEAKLNII